VIPEEYKRTHVNSAGRVGALLGLTDERIGSIERKPTPYHPKTQTTSTTIKNNECVMCQPNRYTGTARGNAFNRRAACQHQARHAVRAQNHHRAGGRGAAKAGRIVHREHEAAVIPQTPLCPMTHPLLLNTQEIPNFPTTIDPALGTRFPFMHTPMLLVVVCRFVKHCLYAHLEVPQLQGLAAQRRHGPGRSQQLESTGIHCWHLHLAFVCIRSQHRSCYRIARLLSRGVRCK
jgi:hypothetical protein